ncbi:putative GPI-anchored protein pfl2 [Contarinia nasturtii]|uniref:putative GPI-anchored protein pfl2 n=1 Tax=Contarinia nasturtii TaxID=265458 RepID=UPI0012D396D7|nr:putative GPI-anchored protein pfl2 [Contarinia nasturtii]XP_031627753.1 putative GPI-anchored protein pfl2 [Contarinia nasturtii]XP_031627761.1 putative GPI-anchored protein pfl2 [Contarinia nasturtii]
MGSSSSSSRVVDGRRTDDRNTTMHYNTPTVYSAYPSYGASSANTGNTRVHTQYSGNTSSTFSSSTSYPSPQPHAQTQYNPSIDLRPQFRSIRSSTHIPSFNQLEEDDVARAIQNSLRENYSNQTTNVRTSTMLLSSSSSQRLNNDSTKMNKVTAETNASKGEMILDCSICMDFKENDEIVATQCGHIFHKGCVSPWIQEAGTCPTCRLRISIASLLKLFVNVNPKPTETTTNSNGKNGANLNSVKPASTPNGTNTVDTNINFDTMFFLARNARNTNTTSISNRTNTINSNPTGLLVTPTTMNTRNTNTATYSNLLSTSNRPNTVNLNPTRPTVTATTINACNTNTASNSNFASTFNSTNTRNRVFRPRLPASTVNSNPAGLTVTSTAINARNTNTATHLNLLSTSNRPNTDNLNPTKPTVTTTTINARNTNTASTSNRINTANLETRVSTSASNRATSVNSNPTGSTVTSTSTNARNTNAVTSTSNATNPRNTGARNRRRNKRTPAMFGRSIWCCSNNKNMTEELLADIILQHFHIESSKVSIRSLQKQNAIATRQTYVSFKISVDTENTFNVLVNNSIWPNSIRAREFMEKK